MVHKLARVKSLSNCCDYGGATGWKDVSVIRDKYEYDRSDRRRHLTIWWRSESNSSTYRESSNRFFRAEQRGLRRTCQRPSLSPAAAFVLDQHSHAIVSFYNRLLLVGSHALLASRDFTRGRQRTLFLMGKRGSPRASCDPCRLKKVKCDKDQRLAEGLSLCSFCCARGYDCIITEVSGNESLELKRRVSAGSDTVASHKKRFSHKQPSSQPQQHTSSNSYGSCHETPLSFVNASSIALPTPATQEDAETSVLGVQGLTRELLDESVMVHYRTTHYCNPCVLPRHFFPRYRACLRFLDGDTSSSSDIEHFPSPEILILAVACLGIAQLRYQPHRFNVQKRIYHRLKDLVEVADQSDPTVALDIIEAILITLDVPPRSMFEMQRGKKDPCYIYPLGLEMMARLIAQHGFNRSASDPIIKAQRAHLHSSDQKHVWEVNSVRIPLVISIAATNDVIRCFNMFQRQYLLEEDLDTDVMKTDLGGTTANAWAHQVFLLASLLRAWNIKICCAKSRRLGLPPSAILGLLEQLRTFERQIPDALRWKVGEESVNGMQVIEQEATLEDALALVVRKAFLHILYWGIIMCVHTLVLAHGIQKPDNPLGDWSMYLRAREKVDSGLLAAVNQVVETASHLASIDLMQCSSIAFRSFPRGCAQYLLEMAQLTYKAGLHELTADLLLKAGRNIYACSMFSAHPESGQEAAEMRRALSALYAKFEMIPGLGPMDDTKLAMERSMFSLAVEPDKSLHPLLSASLPLVGSNDPIYTPLGAAASWTTPTTADMGQLNGSVSELMAGFPFIDQMSPNTLPTSVSQKSPIAQASPFDLNAFLDAHIPPGSV